MKSHSTEGRGVDYTLVNIEEYDDQWGIKIPKWNITIVINRLEFIPNADESECNLSIDYVTIEGNEIDESSKKEFYNDLGQIVEKILEETKTHYENKNNNKK